VGGGCETSTGNGSPAFHPKRGRVNDDAGISRVTEAGDDAARKFRIKFRNQRVTPGGVEVMHGKLRHAAIEQRQRDRVAPRRPRPEARGCP
jgi:hypothetical protein